MAKKSPSTFASSIRVPSTSKPTISPSASSLTLSTSTNPIACSVWLVVLADECGDLLVEGLGVFAEDLALEFDGDAEGEGFVGGVEVPVGVVRREAEEFVGFEPFEDGHEPLEGHFLGGLGGETDLVADDLARHPLDPRHL